MKKLVYLIMAVLLSSFSSFSQKNNPILIGFKGEPLKSQTQLIDLLQKKKTGIIKKHVLNVSPTIYIAELMETIDKLNMQNGWGLNGDSLTEENVLWILANSEIIRMAWGNRLFGMLSFKAYQKDSTKALSFYRKNKGLLYERVLVYEGEVLVSLENGNIRFVSDEGVEPDITEMEVLATNVITVGKKPVFKKQEVKENKVHVDTVKIIEKTVVINNNNEIVKKNNNCCGGVYENDPFISTVVGGQKYALTPVVNSCSYVILEPNGVPMSNPSVYTYGHPYYEQPYYYNVGYSYPNYQQSYQSYPQNNYNTSGNYSGGHHRGGGHHGGNHSSASGTVVNNGGTPYNPPNGGGGKPFNVSNGAGSGFNPVNGGNSGGQPHNNPNGGGGKPHSNRN